MDEKRLTGRFDWYNDLGGYGVIRGDDGHGYFAHHTSFADPFTARIGLRVAFLARPRPRGKGGMEAYDVTKIIETEEEPVISRHRLSSTSPDVRNPAQLSMQRPSAPKPSSPEEINRAAQEALRLKRERRLGQLPERKEDLPPGVRVRHPSLGLGTIELSAKDTISVRFDSQPHKVVDLPRAVFQRPTSTEPPATAQETKPVAPSTASPSVQPGSQIGDFLRQMASEVKERLTEEGLDAHSIYFYEEPAGPAINPQPLAIDERVAAAIRATNGITSFYSHQIQTRYALLDGKHVVISTPTASGKTEAYNPTILESLLRNPSATALYLFPLVALGFDQTERLRRLNDALPEEDRLVIGISNNSVDEEEKRLMLQRKNRIVVTTPESLHYKFLPKPYPNWQTFFRNLRYVVLDEAHVYRGVLGANMANIVRRLLVRSMREGNGQFPQLIISSATVRQPTQLAHQLTGLAAEKFELIDQSGAPRAGRHFLVTRSDIHDLEDICADLLDATTCDAASRNNRPVRTIVFVRSINEVKRSTERLRVHLRKTGKAHMVSSVEGYYSDKGDKADILALLRNGDIKCLFATTALMAGIDIGGLDVAIVKHFPGMVMDARQMFGRAGRAGEGAVIFIADRLDPFDQFYFERPDHLFRGPTEEVVANPENPYLLAAHLRCAAQTSQAKYKNQEGPLSGRWVELFGSMGRDLLDLLTEQGKLRVQAGSYYMDVGEPHDSEPLDNIRSMSNVTYTLKNEVDDQLLEEKREDTAFRDAHPEAILWCKGEKFKVLKFDRESHQILCRPEPNRDLRTQGVEERTVEILSIDQSDGHDDIQSRVAEIWMHSGRVKVTTSVSMYKTYETRTVMRCRNRRCRHETPNLDVRRCVKCGGAVRVKQSERMTGTYPIPMDPPLSMELDTRACWLEFPPGVRERFEQVFWPRWSSGNNGDAPLVPSFEHAIHSLEHAILKAFPERIRCDRDEIGGIYFLNLEGLAARLFIYDNFPGGLGLADDYVYDPLPVIEGALSVIERCTCDEDGGCPVCLAQFGCHQFNMDLSKLAGRYLLRVLLGQDTRPVIEDLEEYVRICGLPSRAREEIHEPS